ncbi:hypothetical protein [Lysobacter sp. F60174L2]|uniref:hypothetical protein n=1 Tax=Lysobacter sp. F60174L2 TaxID=3459295 RepID=UPI00403DE262
MSGADIASTFQRALKKRAVPTHTLLLVILALSTVSIPAAAQDRDWTWMVEPYAWAASIGTDMRTVRPPTEAGSDVSFSDVVDKLDGVFMMRVEGRNDRYGVFADFIYLGLADSSQRRVMTTETDLDARVLDAAVSVRAGDRYTGLDVYGGIRYIDVDLTTRFTPENPTFVPRTLDTGNTYVDLLLGGRYAWRLSERWELTARADASAGETDNTWSASLMTRYRTGNGGWLFGYRYMQAKLDSDNADLTLDLSGPLIGYGFEF